MKMHECRKRGEKRGGEGLLKFTFHNNRYRFLSEISNWLQGKILKNGWSGKRGPSLPFLFAHSLVLLQLAVLSMT
jgi:hypothetical protein